MKYLIIILLFISSSILSHAQDKAFLSAYDKHWEISDGFYRVMNDHKIGLVNQYGDVIIPCENDQIWDLQKNGNIKVLKNGKLGLYNTSGDLIVPVIYDMIWDFKDGKARVLRNGKIGYVNLHGNEFIPCIYDQIGAFSEGKAKVLKNGKTGYVNLSGLEVIPADYQKIWDFKNGKAKVLRNGKMGYINSQGVEIIPCQYQHIGDFKNGSAQVIQNGHISYIDANGNPTTPIESKNLAKDTTLYDRHQVSNDREIIQSNFSTSNKDTTTLNLWGSKIAIVDENGAKEFSFDHHETKDWTHKSKRKSTKFKGHYWGMDLGLNNYLNANHQFSLPDSYSNLSLHTGKSIELNINILQQNIGLGQCVGFVTGLGLNYNNYRFDNPNIPVTNENGQLEFEEISETLEKNKLTTLYLNAPLMFELQFSRRRHSAFYLSTGMIAGYRLKSYTKVITKVAGERNKEKNKDSFALNDFRYGAHVRIGFKAINLYGTYYFTQMFEKDQGPELYPVSFGISMYPGFW